MSKETSVLSRRIRRKGTAESPGLPREVTWEPLRVFQKSDAFLHFELPFSCLVANGR